MVFIVRAHRLIKYSSQLQRLTSGSTGGSMGVKIVRAKCFQKFTKIVSTIHKH